jgi:hypothetical protein
MFLFKLKSIETKKVNKKSNRHKQGGGERDQSWVMAHFFFCTIFVPFSSLGAGCHHVHAAAATEGPQVEAKNSKSMGFNLPLVVCNKCLVAASSSLSVQSVVSRQRERASAITFLFLLSLTFLLHNLFAQTKDNNMELAAAAALHMQAHTSSRRPASNQDQQRSLVMRRSDDNNDNKTLVKEKEPTQNVRQWMDKVSFIYLAQLLLPSVVGLPHLPPPSL